MASCYLDGFDPRPRPGLINEFRAGGAPVFMISLRQAASGNSPRPTMLPASNPGWNPATEAQAVDRQPTIGQTQVMVYRLIAASTIEEKVMRAQARKAEDVHQRHRQRQRLRRPAGRRRHPGAVR